jgi:hypothetical protein
MTCSVRFPDTILFDFVGAEDSVVVIRKLLLWWSI